MSSIRTHNLRLAYRSMKAARVRSFLTMLGIIIGVMAVVLVVCIGQGVKQQIAGQLNHYGKRTLLVEPGTTDSSALSVGSGARVTSLLSESDWRQVQKTKGIEYAVPLSVATGSIQGDHAINSPLVIATTADFTDVVRQSMASGGFFEAKDKEQAVVLGSGAARKLFDDNAPLGQMMVWRGQQFMVAGVFDDFKAPPFSPEASFNEAVFVPYDTAQSLSSGVLGMYQIVAKHADTVTDLQAKNAVAAALTAVHGGAQDVQVRNAAEAHTAPDQTIHLITMLVTGVAIIALIVGSIGIMDVMLVSVAERIHEIGLRKAIGATNVQIMRQFVAEAFVLSTVGALLGTVLSCIVVGILRLYSSLQAVLVWQVLIIAPLVAITVGVFFGSIPALKAASKDPIDALRYE